MVQWWAWVPNGYALTRAHRECYAITTILLAFCEPLEVSQPHGVSIPSSRFVARFSIAAVSGNRPDQGGRVCAGHRQWRGFQLGWPRLSDNAVALFREITSCPVLPPEWGALMAATGEHVLPLLLLLGLAMTVGTGAVGHDAGDPAAGVPRCLPTHGTWAAQCCCTLMAHGPGQLSLDADCTALPPKTLHA